jgi:hypothetical protein
MQRFLPCSSPLGYLPLLFASGLGGGLLASLASISPASALDQISGWQFDPVRQQLTITLSPQVTPTYKIRADGRAILLYLPATRLGASPTSSQYDGPVRQVHLSQIESDQVEVTLELAVGVEVTAEQVTLVALRGESETRWLLTALVAEGRASVIPSQPFSPQMTGELSPVAADPNLNWPYQGIGRLSIAAANLMLPANLDSFNTLPETLAIDPFNLGLPSSSEPVSVPTLAELDVAVGQAQVELVPATASSLPVPDLPQGGPTASLTLPPPTQPSLPVEIGQNQQETPATPSPSLSSVSDLPSTPETVAAIPGPVNSEADFTVVTQEPTTLLADSNPYQGQAAPAQPQPDPLTIEPPAAEIPAYLPSPSTPEPGSEPVLMAAEQPIPFGQPLPGQALSSPVAQPNDRPLPPDILIASGTILELRYPGSEDLVLTPNLPLNEVLVLAQDLRDPITQGIIAPAGSQLIGQFETVGHHQQWVSHMIILPTGQRVPFPSTSDYLVGTPQVSGGSLALGSGVGALALILLGGLSGVGLLGGALMGATATLGMAPQTIVIEPNQIIYAQVMDDIPRAIPIALAPATIQPWGTAPNW